MLNQYTKSIQYKNFTPFILISYCQISINIEEIIHFIIGYHLFSYEFIDLFCKNWVNNASLCYSLWYSGSFGFGSYDLGCTIYFFSYNFINTFPSYCTSLFSNTVSTFTYSGFFYTLFVAWTWGGGGTYLFCPLVFSFSRYCLLFVEGCCLFKGGYCCLLIEGCCCLLIGGCYWTLLCTGGA